MRALLIEFFIIGCVLIFASQIAIPAFYKNLDYWWLFKSKDKPVPKEGSLRDRVHKGVKDFREVKKEVDTNLADAKDLKQQTDTLTPKPDPECPHDIPYTSGMDETPPATTL